ncbi:MAG: hypothetical protein IH612_03795 [Desulfofustis sp.]|nr:hypothetical protein [Desulfofustis sp.]
MAAGAEPDINDGLRIVSYSANPDGRCIGHQDHGWQPVNIVNRQAWQEIEKRIAASRNKVAAGSVSCLHYYMTAHQMTPALLARYTGQASWLVRLHLVPFIFNRLGRATLQKYAELFQVSIADLTGGEMRPPIYCRG